MTRLAMIIAFRGFRDEEFYIPHELFLKAGYTVDVYSSQLGSATGKLGGSYQVTHVLADLLPEAYDGLVFIGGPGGHAFLGNSMISQKIVQAEQEGKLLAAICMAPQILGEAGVLLGRRATVFPGDKDVIIKQGALYTGQSVEIDGQIITADGPASATLFAQAVIQYFS